jgi:hypothetical protein
LALGFVDSLNIWETVHGTGYLNDTGTYVKQYPKLLIFALVGSILVICAAACRISH